MDLKKCLYIFYEFVFHLAFSIIYILLFAYYYPPPSSYERMGLAIMLIFLIRIDKCLTFVSIYFKKSSLEFETTIVLLLIYLMNFIKAETVETSNYFWTVTEVVFYGILIANLLAYLYSFTIILFFGLMILYLVLRGGGGQNNLGLNINSRGLTEEQLQAIEDKLYREVKEENIFEPNNNNNDQMQIDIAPNDGDGLNQDLKENEKVCSICLNEFQDEEIVSKLPECKHIFHKECIREWLLRNHICPFCRNDVKKALRRKKRAMIHAN